MVLGQLQITEERTL